MGGIEIRNVTKTFPSSEGNGRLCVFREFSLAIPDGEILAIVGPSGCGKTTLLNMLALLEPLDFGLVRLDDRVLVPSDLGRLSLGYLFQRDALLPWRTAWENALLGLECRGRVTEKAKEIAGEYFRRFGLESVRNAWPSTLSGGQRQRVALIQSLLVEPDILLLDEPFGGVDFQTKLMLEAELLSVVRPASGNFRRKAVVFVTHDIEEAITLADRVIVFGMPPVRILLDRPVELPDEFREPVKARQSEVMSDLFGRIWAALQSGEEVDPQSGRPYKPIDLRPSDDGKRRDQTAAPVSVPATTAIGGLPRRSIVRRQRAGGEGNGSGDAG
jgi:NitT/TauT family transport system ATP-binding protein